MIGQQRDADRPEQFDIGLEEMAVAVDCFRAEENLQVAHHVADDKQKQDGPVPAIRYFLPSDEQNRLRNKLVMNRWACVSNQRLSANLMMNRDDRQRQKSRY